MTVVYVVADGAYSDYHVVGICSTLEIAKRLKEIHDASQDVEVWTLDCVPDVPPGLLPWSLKMDEHGNSQDIKREPPPLDDGGRWAPYGDRLKRWVYFVMWARDAEHAVKIANEWRVALIASGEWTSDWDVWQRMQKEKRVKP